MKNIIYLFSLLALLVISCNKKLDLIPIGSISQTNFYKTSEDANAAVIACYNTLIAFHTGWGVVSGEDMWGDIQSSDAEPHPDGVA